MWSYDVVPRVTFNPQLDLTLFFFSWWFSFVLYIHTVSSVPSHLQHDSSVKINPWKCMLLMWGNVERRVFKSNAISACFLFLLSMSVGFALFFLCSSFWFLHFPVSCFGFISCSILKLFHPCVLLRFASCPHLTSSAPFSFFFFCLAWFLTDWNDQKHLWLAAVMKAGWVLYMNGALMHHLLSHYHRKQWRVLFIKRKWLHPTVACSCNLENKGSHLHPVILIHAIKWG